MTDFDVIIIGGGPNGETVGSYLARAGAECLIIERRDEMGGGMITESFGGFRFNLHATYSMMGDTAPPIEDLFLEQFGFDFYRPEVQLNYIPPNDDPIPIYADPERTARAIGKVSESDAEAFERLYADAVEINERYTIPHHYTEPRPPDEDEEILSGHEVGEKVLQIRPLSPLEVLEHYGIEDEHVKAALTYPGCVWGPHPRQEGVGHMFAFFLYRMSSAGLISGGTHRLSSSLLRSYHEEKGDVLEMQAVTDILVEDGAVTGVVTDEGERFTADAVVSTLNPEQTFLDLLDEEHVDDDILNKARNWEWDAWSMFMVHMGVEGTPVYPTQGGNGRTDALLNLVGYDGLDDLLDHWDACGEGRVPEPEGGWTNTSQIDPTQAPPGYQTVRFETQVPFDVSDRDWEEFKDDFAQRCIDQWLDTIENPDEVDIRKTYFYPPTWIKQKLPEMEDGSIRHGAYIPEQMGYNRPHPKCSNTRTPIEGLYVAGASTHPGGMVTLGPGYIAAGKVAEDIGIDTWWEPPEYLVEARAEGLVPGDTD